jgi:hypothetical protein
MKHQRQPLTPELLGQFSKLGVSKAGGEPLPDPIPMLSTHELKERGWTAGMITKLLPRHDSTRANQLEVGRSRKLLPSPVKLYKLARVEEVETTEEFLIAQAEGNKGKARAQKGVATRTEKLRAYIAGYTPQLADPPDPLTGHELWKHHLRELTMYEHEHTEEWLSLSKPMQRQGSNELYNIHRDAFRAKFGEHY